MAKSTTLKSSRTRSAAERHALQRRLLALAERNGVMVDEVVVMLRRFHALMDEAARIGEPLSWRRYAQRLLREVGLPAPVRRPRGARAR
jgi:hypothetical protein